MPARPRWESMISALGSRTPSGIRDTGREPWVAAQDPGRLSKASPWHCRTGPRIRRCLRNLKVQVPVKLRNGRRLRDGRVIRLVTRASGCAPAVHLLSSGFRILSQRALMAYGAVIRATGTSKRCWRSVSRASSSSLRKASIEEAFGADCRSPRGTDGHQVVLHDEEMSTAGA